MKEEIKLLGGPRDGETYSWNDPGPFLHFAYIHPLATVDLKAEDPIEESRFWRLEYVCLYYKGMPSRDDQGRLTYKYQGMYK